MRFYLVAVIALAGLATLTQATFLKSELQSNIEIEAESLKDSPLTCMNI